MQTASSMSWTEVNEFISNNDNHYAMCECLYVCVCVCVIVIQQK